MSQTNYDFNMKSAFAGVIADNGPNDIKNYNHPDAIAPGLGVIKYIGADEKVRLPKVNQSVITEDAGTYTAGDIVANVVINGADPVVVTTVYDTDKATTLANFATDILVVAGIDTSVYSAPTLTVTSNNSDIAITVDVSGITGTMTISSIVASSTDTTLEAVAVHTHTLSEQGYVYEANSPVSAIRKGRIYVTVEEDVTSDDSVYLRVQPGTLASQVVGGFRKSADSGKAVIVSGAVWSKGALAGEVAVLEINLP